MITIKEEWAVSVVPQDKIKILMIIPAYNEGENIERVVTELTEFTSSLGDRDYVIDYVVVNDGSKDNTAFICRQKGYNLVDLPINLGLAGAFQTGMKYAFYNGYDYAVQYDGDGQHDVRYVPVMYESARNEGLDICIGSRFVTEKKPGSMRMLGSNIIAFCIKLTTGKTIKDPTSGMRMFNKAMIEKLARGMNLGPEPDTVAFLMRHGAKVGECQVSMRERVAGESYLNMFSSVKYMYHICSSILIAQWFRG